MHLAIDLPDQKPGLDAAIAKQFAEIQRQLMGLVKDSAASKSQMHMMMMDGMAEQQDQFLKAMERLMGMVGKTLADSPSSKAAALALKGLQSALEDLPADLKGALERHSMKSSRPYVPVRPQITVAMPAGITQRLDSLETAMLGGMRRWRSRTFGSNN